MKILAFLQNQWFKNPEAIAILFNRYPNKRNEFIKRLLFAGCLTGRRLHEVFGDLCNKIIWDEASPLLADHSSGVFKADIAHIAASIKQHRPDLIICFGKIAGDAVKSLSLQIKIIYAPHPATRGNTIEALKKVNEFLEKYLSVTR